MHIVAVSDTHSFHRSMKVPDGDVLVHAGDMTGHGTLEEVQAFNEWLGTLPHAHKIIIAGNHDWAFQDHPDKARALVTNATYLQDSEVVVDGIKFYGSPWQPEFCNWAFNLVRGTLHEKWDLIPDDVDVLITHGPPTGHGDYVRRDEHVGCDELLKAVERVVPRFHVFGHIHEGYGTTQAGNTTFINASTCTLHYRPDNAPVEFDI